MACSRWICFQLCEYNPLHRGWSCYLAGFLLWAEQRTGMTTHFTRFVNFECVYLAGLRLCCVWFTSFYTCASSYNTQKMLYNIVVEKKLNECSTTWAVLWAINIMPSWQACGVQLISHQKFRQHWRGRGRWWWRRRRQRGRRIRKRGETMGTHLWFFFLTKCSDTILCLRKSCWKCRCFPQHAFCAYPLRFHPWLRRHIQFN